MTANYRALAYALAFVACVVLANVTTSAVGLVTVAGLTVTAGTFFAGVTFVLRDNLQDQLRRPVPTVVALVALGAAVSYLLSDPFVALASGLAFLVSELADFAVYSPLRSRGYLRAAIASNVVGSIVDTVLFLWVAGFPVWEGTPDQVAVKLAVTTLGAGATIALRRARRG